MTPWRCSDASSLVLEEEESVGEMSGESHCRRLIRVWPSGISKLSLSSEASALGSIGLQHQTQTDGAKGKKKNTQGWRFSLKKPLAETFLWLLTHQSELRSTSAGARGGRSELETSEFNKNDFTSR